MKVKKDNYTYHKSNKATEPESTSEKIHIFNSFAEAETATILKTLKQTPEERLSETVHLIRRVYREKPERICKQIPENKIRWKVRP